MLRRIGGSATSKLVVQSNLANTYHCLGRLEKALRMRREVYTGTSKLWGEEHRETLHEASNYSVALLHLEHFQEAKALLRKSIPIARRVIGENHDITLRTRTVYAMTLYMDTGATLDDLHEAVTTIQDTGRIARRVFGGAHPLVAQIERVSRDSRAALRARGAPPGDSP